MPNESILNENTARDLQSIRDIKAALKTAIEELGATVGDEPFEDYPGSIRGVASSIQSQINGILSALDGKQATLTFDSAPTENSTNPVTSGGIYTALAGKQDTLTFDNAPTENSNNPVKSGGVYSALQAGKQKDIISVSQALPVATASSADFVQYDGKLYRKKTIGQVSVTDLTNTVWTLNDTLDDLPSRTRSLTVSYYLNFTSNSLSYTELKDDENQFQYINNGDITAVYQGGAPEGERWNDSYKTISISGGYDVENTALIEWFFSNATLVSGGTVVYSYSYENVALSSEKESYEIENSDWENDLTIDEKPYTNSVTVTATHTIGNDTEIELINDQAVLFATHGFSIGSVSGQSVTFYSIDRPSTNVTLEVEYNG